MSTTKWAPQGAMFGFKAVPSDTAKIAGMAFHTVLQLSLRLPLTLLRGISKCKCGCDLDQFGDHILSCGLFTSYRTVMHDLIEEVAMHMARRAGHRHITHDSRIG